jgi:hypothetical protein
MTTEANTGLGQGPRSLGLLLDELVAEGTEIWERFDREVRVDHWHPFIASDYQRVREALLALREPGLRFLEWGSANGVITIMADLIGFEACGIELDADLVATARALAVRFGSRARFAAGSFVPAGYRPRLRNGEGRLGTIGDGPSAYGELGLALDDFDLVYAYPWKGEERAFRDLFEQYGGRKARLLLNGDDGVTIHRHGAPAR